jgi:hypothetical protein
LSPKTVAGQAIFFFYGLLGISSLGFFVVSLRNAVIEQFQWRLVDRFSKPAHLTRVQTRMSAKDIPFPIARFEEEQRVKMVVKRKMIVRMGFIWIFMWFGGAAIFCAFEPWTYLESLYFCVSQNKDTSLHTQEQQRVKVDLHTNYSPLYTQQLVCYFDNNRFWRLCAHATRSD